MEEEYCMVVYIGKTSDRLMPTYEIGVTQETWDPHLGFVGGRLFEWLAPFRSEEFEQRTGIVLGSGELCKAKIRITDSGFTPVRL